MSNTRLMVSNPLPQSKNPCPSECNHHPASCINQKTWSYPWSSSFPPSSCPVHHHVLSVWLPKYFLIRISWSQYHHFYVDLVKCPPNGMGGILVHSCPPISSSYSTLKLEGLYQNINLIMSSSWLKHFCTSHFLLYKKTQILNIPCKFQHGVAPSSPPA